MQAIPFVNIFLLPYIEAFYNRYPGIKIQIVNRPSPVIHNSVEQGQIELGIVNVLPDYKNRKLKLKPIMEFEDVFIASDRYLELTHGSIRLDELSQYPLISLGKNSTTRLYFNQLVKEHQLDYLPEIELGSIDLIIEMVKIGIGIGFVSEFAAKSEIKKGNLYKINVDAAIPKRRLGIISAQNLPISAAAQAFVDLLEKDMTSL